MRILSLIMDLKMKIQKNQTKYLIPCQITDFLVKIRVVWMKKRGKSKPCLLSIKES